MTPVAELERAHRHEVLDVATGTVNITLRGRCRGRLVAIGDKAG